MSKKEFVWAIDENGKPCKCTAKPENRGKRNCKHRFHQEPGQNTSDFFKEHGLNMAVCGDPSDPIEEIHPLDTQSEEDRINAYASKIDEICGTHVTEENYNDVILGLTPEQLDALNKVGFEAAPEFSLPITDEMYNDTNVSNKIYFSELPDYGIGGKKTAMRDMFGSIGSVPSFVEEYDIEGNYRDGLSARDYFEKQFSTRGSQIAKTVSVSAPGHSARLLFYGLSDVEVIDDCGNDSSDGIMHCKAPGICKKCAAKSGLNVDTGSFVGATISTHLTEGLTQASLNSIHTGTGMKQDWEVISDTILGYKSSPIIAKAIDQDTTEGARKVIFDGLKQVYKDAGINIDDYNLQVVSKQLTSYKRNNDGSIRYIKDGELCDFPSMQTIGGHNNLFLQSELKNSYDKITTPHVFDNKRNAVNSIAG